MPVVKRADGAVFISQPYRECLGGGSSRMMQRAIVSLSEQRGAFVNLMPHESGGMEVALSRDSGYLLGESLWVHVGKPQHLLFCEYVAHLRQFLLVVVVDGRVHVDALLQEKQLAKELLPFLGGQYRFMVMVGRDTPFECTTLTGLKSLAPEALALPAESVRVFRYHEHSMFDRVLPNAAQQLLPLTQALLPLRRSFWQWGWVLGFVVLVFCFSVLWKNHQSAEVPSPVVLEDVRSKFSQVFSGPSASQQLRTLEKTLWPLETMPGWMVHEIAYEGGRVHLTVLPSLGDISDLQQWALTQGWRLHLSPDGPSLEKNLSFSYRPHHGHVPVLLEPLLVDLMLRVKRLFPERSVRLLEKKSEGSWTEARLEIGLHEVSLGTLTLLAKAFHGLPLRIEHVRVNLREGMLYGEMTVTMLGE